MAKTKPAELEEWMTGLTEGQVYLFESVTSHQYIGILKRILGPHTVVLTDCVWVADTGRLHEFFRDGNHQNAEIEKIGIRCVHWASWSPWTHAIPETK